MDYVLIIIYFISAISLYIVCLRMGRNKMYKFNATCVIESHRNIYTKKL